MSSRSRKLLPPDYGVTAITSGNFSTSISSSSSSSMKFQERETPINYSTTTTNSCCYNNFKLNPPFDSAMALTVLVLLTALFFMGFFSIYIRRFSDESSGDPDRRRRHRSSDYAADLSSTTSYLPRSRAQAKGLDPKIVESLPVHAYGGEHAIEWECAICLSEFEERDWVKEIPYCGHVFHVECIDKWLFTHVTCPLCRTEKLFPAPAPAVERVREVVEADVAVGDGGGGEVQLTVDERDTWNGGESDVGPSGVRRSSSGFWCGCGGERVTLHRSLSF